MTTYNITANSVSAAARPATLLRLSFGTQAGNDQIVKDVVARLKELQLSGGKMVLLNGPASLPVAIAIGHGVSHLFAAVACFDPKLVVDGKAGGAYVVSVSHDPEMPVGTLISGADVQS
jgi:CRISPR-associated protein Csx3